MAKVAAITGLICVTFFFLSGLIGNEATLIIDELLCSIKEVFTCLPVQQCTENNSVNSAKICWEWFSHKLKGPSQN